MRGFSPMNGAALSFRQVTLVREGRTILRDIDWEVRPGERWVVLGPNGAGKSTLLTLAGARELPTRGRLHVLGNRVGGVDLRTIRPAIGVVSALLGRDIAPRQTAFDVVVTGTDATLRLWRQEFTADERRRAAELLDFVGAAHLRDRLFETLSDGERLRVLIARALVPEPRLLLLDEPTASLDLAGREQLLAVLDRLATVETSAALVLVTHRVEEIPRSTTHALLVRDGGIHAAGTVDKALTSETLSSTFDVPLRLERMEGRFVAL